ncbi:MAG: DUF2207 domain-containing protein [Planifilum fimeticola]
MKKTSALCFLLLILIFLPGCDEERDYTIERLDIRAYILEDGDLYVEELYTYDFKGEFNGTTRTIKDNGHDGVEFFEAYLPPPGKELGEFTFEDSQPLKTERKEETFYVYTASKNEKKRVFYRYRLSNAVRKYKDTAEFYWAFFDSSNESDLHRVTIDVILPKPFDHDQIRYFLHERADGRITDITDYSIRYQTPLFPAGVTSEIRLLFPGEFLPKAEWTANKNMKADILSEEKALQARFAAREKRLETGKAALDLLSLTLLAAILLYILFRILRRALARGESGEAGRLEELDPLLVALVYRTGNRAPQDLIAGLFSLYQKDAIRIEKLEEDETFKFLWTEEKKNLESHERYLIDSFFRDSENIEGKKYRTCTLDSLVKLSQSSFDRWKDLVLKFYAPYARKSRFLKYLTWCLFTIQVGLIIYLCYADVASLGSIIVAGAVLGIAAWISALLYQYKRSIIPFLGISSIMLAFLLQTEDLNYGYFVLAVLSGLFLAIIPVYSLTLKGTSLRLAVKSWRKALEKGTYPVGSEPAKKEKLLQYAIVLGVSPSFVHHYGKGGEYEEVEKRLPLLSNPMKAATTFAFTSLSLGSSGSGSSGGGGSGGGGGAGAF